MTEQELQQQYSNLCIQAGDCFVKMKGFENLFHMKTQEAAEIHKRLEIIMSGKQKEETK